MTEPQPLRAALRVTQEGQDGADPKRAPRRGAGLERILEQDAIDDRQLDALFGVLLAPFKRAVLAVSGGPDSMALMLLAARWVASGRAPSTLALDVATVDHGLRSSSSREADWVAERAKALGFTHTTLVWGGDKPSSGVQARAREARYALLAAHASAHAPAAIVTAHTADDQAETLLMRLGRGSGLDGLSGMTPSRRLLPDGSVRLVRPLLGLAKADLTNVLTQAGSGWLDDPSNERLDFERVRIRAAHESLEALGLSNDKLALSAARLGRAREALDLMTEQRLAELVDHHNGIYASMERVRWHKEPQEIRVRILARLLAAYGGDARLAQLSQIEALDAVLAEGRPVAQTLGGCIVSQGGTTLRLYREPGHRTLPEIALAPGSEVLWDWRFRIRYAARDDGEPELEPVCVRALGLPAYATLRASIAPAKRPPARAAAGLPSVWSGERLLAVPALPGALAEDGQFTGVFLGLSRDKA